MNVVSCSHTLLQLMLHAADLILFQMVFFVIFFSLVFFEHFECMFSSLTVCLSCGCVHFVHFFSD